jgi:hypothetical protein
MKKPNYLVTLPSAAVLMLVSLTAFADGPQGHGRYDGHHDGRHAAQARHTHHVSHGNGYGYSRYHWNNHWYYARQWRGYHVTPVVCGGRFSGYGYYGAAAPRGWVPVGCGYWAPRAGVWMP